MCQRVPREGNGVGHFCSMEDDRAENGRVMGGEHGDKCVATIIRSEQVRGSTDSASSGRSWSSRMNTSTRTRRSLL